jgi:hypothetical protein
LPFLRLDIDTAHSHVQGEEHVFGGETRFRRAHALAVSVLTLFGVTTSVGVAVLVTAAPAAAKVTGAVSTTDDADFNGASACLNGNGTGVGDTNCNIYANKTDVFLSGLPVTASLGDGTYFFAVLDPRGQQDPNDGTSGNLSSPVDSWQAREFSVNGGTITNLGTHAFDQLNNLLQLAPYDDTKNPGGVYIMAVCAVPANPADLNGPGVTPSDCKYDAFKVGNAQPQPALALNVTKDANGSYTRTFGWTISKSVDKTTVKQVGGTATFNYTVTVSHDPGTSSNIKVVGTIQVFNPNVDASNNLVPVAIDGVTDQLSDDTVCTVDNGGPQVLTLATTSFTYECDLAALPQGELDNTATVSWSDQLLNNGTELAANSASWTFKSILFTPTDVHNCVDVTDSYAGTLGTVCVGSSANPTTFTYSRTISVQPGCLQYNNTATFTATDDPNTTGSAGQTVTVCGPAKTGALTIGFWKTTNGQGLVKTYCNDSSPNLGTYLDNLGAGQGPFGNAPTGCSALASYVYNILNGASATNMNNMLQAQMLGTALDVWFSGPGWTSTKIGSVKPPSTFLTHNNLGSFNMDTTAICPMVDGLSTGTATCQNNTPSTDAVAAGAVPTSPMSMQSLLDFAATTPSPFIHSTSASVWYGGNRTLEEVLKNIFDQFNNQMAFGSF